jgi:glycosyltransferase involved in cell wall biosynthesis
VDASDYLVLLLGNFSPDKGYLFLHDVAQNVSHPHLCFVLAGHPASKPAGRLHLLLRKLYRTLHPRAWNPEKIVAYWQSDSMKARGLFPGHLPAIDALAAADLVVCPNVVPEPFGRTVIEAFAAKKAVLTSDLPAFDETIQQGENGWRLPLDPKIWADFLDDLATHPEKGIEVAEKAYKSRLRYDAVACAETVQGMYENILK